MTDPYTLQHEGLVGVHRALADAFAPIVAGATTPLDVLVPQARGAASFLLAHHDMESKGLFPGLRRYGRLRSSDVSFLDACDREHHALHELCDRLLAAAAAPHPSAATIAGLARDTLAVLAPHTREEEAGLAPANLRLMIDVPGLTELGHELEAMRARALAKLAASS
jgi:hypothetical protein